MKNTKNTGGAIILSLSAIAMAWNAAEYAQESNVEGYYFNKIHSSNVSRDTASEQVNSIEKIQNNFAISHPADKKWTQSELLKRAKKLSTNNPQIMIDVFRSYEERSEGTNELITRSSIFPEVQIFSQRKESHSKVQDPTPAEFMAVWVDNKLEFVFAVSTATYRKRFVPKRQSWENPTTPAGDYDPIYLNKLHHSRTYKPVDAEIGPEMPYSIFIDDPAKELLKSFSGYAFHGTTLSHYDALGTPDSGGCIRLSREDAEVLFTLVNPKLETWYRLGRWFGEEDPRNQPNKNVIELRDRFNTRVLDPEYLSQRPELENEIRLRYEPLLGYLNLSVNNNIQRSLETLALGKYRTLRENLDD